MKRVNYFYLVIFMLLMPFLSRAQDEEKKEVKVKMVKISDGKSIVTDTTFITRGDAESEIKLYIDEITGHDSVDATKVIKVEVFGESGNASKENYKVMIFSGEEEGKQVFISSPNGKEKGFRWIDAEGEEQEFDFRMEEIEEITMNLEYQMKDLEKHREQIEREVEVVKGPDGFRWKHLPPPPPPRPERYEYKFFGDRNESHGMVSQEELREAGIKEQPDKLMLDVLDINNQNGLVILRFMPATDKGKVKVTVYNYFGDKVFSAKPEMVGDVYQTTIDLSAKQPGLYYIQLSRQNESVTKRIKL